MQHPLCLSASAGSVFFLSCENLLFYSRHRAREGDGESKSPPKHCWLLLVIERVAMELRCPLVVLEANEQIVQESITGSPLGRLLLTATGCCSESLAQRGDVNNLAAGKRPLPCPSPLRGCSLAAYQLHQQTSRGAGPLSLPGAPSARKGLWLSVTASRGLPCLPEPHRLWAARFWARRAL